MVFSLFIFYLFFKWQLTLGVRCHIQYRHNNGVNTHNPACRFSSCSRQIFSCCGPIGCRISIIERTNQTGHSRQYFPNFVSPPPPHPHPPKNNFFLKKIIQQVRKDKYLQAQQQTRQVLGCRYVQSSQVGRQVGRQGGWLGGQVDEWVSQVPLELGA